MHTPKNILLATDLSSRADRALDRAVALARFWQATLHVLYVQKPETTGAWFAGICDDAAQTKQIIHQAREQLCHDMHGRLEDMVVHIELGNVVSQILQTAQSQGCELIIIGDSSPGFATITDTDTAAQLLRRARQSVLVVRERAARPYQKLLVGTDFTPEAAHSFEKALQWFKGGQFYLVHALDIAYRSMLLEAGRDREFIRMEQEAMADFVAQTTSKVKLQNRLQTFVEYGHPEAVLYEYASAYKTQLTVVGAAKRSRAYHMLVGGSAIRIVRTLPGDVLVIHH